MLAAKRVKATILLLPIQAKAEGEVFDARSEQQENPPLAFVLWVYDDSVNEDVAFEQLVEVSSRDIRVAGLLFEIDTRKHWLIAINTLVEKSLQFRNQSNLHRVNSILAGGFSVCP